MKVIIAGSRQLKRLIYVKTAVHYARLTITEVVSGGCEGVDQAGEKWANLNNIPIRQFLPAWHEHGRGAGPIRNREMAEYADALIAVWDGKSRGTRDMIDCAIQSGLDVFVMLFHAPNASEPDWPESAKGGPKFKVFWQQVTTVRGE